MHKRGHRAGSGVRVLVRGATECKRIFQSLYSRAPFVPTAAPSPSRRRQRPVLASSPLLFFFLDGPARVTRALDVHAPPPDVDVPWGSTETDVRVPALGCLCRLFPWPGRAPPTALAGLHRAQDAGCGYGNGGPPRPRPRARGEDSLVVVSTRCRARRRLEGPPSGNRRPCGESTSSDRRMSYP